MAVQDKEFKDSYWSFDIRSELAKAFREFKRQFGIDLRLKEIKDWDSIGSIDLKDFPFNFIQRISKGYTIEEIVEYLVDACKKEMGLPIEISENEKDSICEKLNDKLPAYQMGFLEAKLECWMQECFFRDLQIKEPISLGVGVMYAFSGKLSIQLHSMGCTKIGKIYTKEAYALIGNSSLRGTQPNRVILHELGHLFGASHTKDESVMRESPVSTYDFDPVNRDIIVEKIKSITTKNS